jgi:TolB-like protein/tetratricopeptide (TPR) repeat protein
MSDVFISYKTEDRARVKPLVEALVAEGLSVWWDVHIEAGAAWRAAIQANLDAAACVLVVWSVHSVGPAGHFVQDEASRAQRRGVYLPVALDGVEAPLGFGEHQLLRLGDWRGERRDPRLLDVMAAVKAAIAGGPRPVPKSTAPVPGRVSRSWRFAAVAAAVLAVGAGLIVAKAPARLCEAFHWDCPGLTAPANSIAVLPFANLSGDPGQDYFSDGLSEELIGALSRLKALQVVARTSSFKFKGGHDSSAAIGAKLGVAYLLDGSVRRDGALVRVGAELVDSRTGFERWSQTYNREMKDIFAVQSGIAEAVADGLRVRLLSGDIAALSHGGTKSPEAYDSYLRGRRLAESGGGEAGHREALARFDAAIAADPRYAAPYVGRASVLINLANLFVTADQWRETYDAALVAAQRAVQLAPDVASTQAMLATALVYAHHDFHGASPIFARALAEGPGEAGVLMEYGLFICQTGDCGRGLGALERARTLDPLNPKAYYISGQVLIAARRYEEAIVVLRRALDLSPSSSGVHARIADAMMLEGRLAGARNEYALEPTAWERLTGQAIVLRRMGDKAGAQAAFKALIADGEDSSAYQVAEVRAQWGDVNGAIAALDRAFQTNDPGVLSLNMDRLMDPLRGAPEFAGRLRNLGLVASR